MGLSAGVVHEQDQYIQGTFKVAVNAGIGNPYASEEEITGKGWGEVLSDNPYTQVRDADYSMDSFRRAGDNSLQAWKNTAWDVSTANGDRGRSSSTGGLRDDLNDKLRRCSAPPPRSSRQRPSSRPPARGSPPAA